VVKRSRETAAGLRGGGANKIETQEPNSRGVGGLGWEGVQNFNCEEEDKEKTCKKKKTRTLTETHTP